MLKPPLFNCRDLYGQKTTLTAQTSVVLRIDEVRSVGEVTTFPLTSRHEGHTPKTDRFAGLGTPTSWSGANFKMSTHVKGELLTSVQSVTCTDVQPGVHR